MGVRIAGITGQRVVHIMSMLQCVCRWKSAARGPRRECAADKTMLERCVLERLPKCASATIPINVHGGAHDHAPRCPLVVNLTMCVLMELRCARTAARVRAAISEMLDLRAIECEL